jgi:hypothetical protein
LHQPFVGIGCYLILSCVYTLQTCMYSSLFNVKFIRNFKTLQQNSPWATKESIFHSIFLLYNQRMCILTIASFITSTYLHCLGNFIFNYNILYKLSYTFSDSWQSLLFIEQYYSRLFYCYLIYNYA